MKVILEISNREIKDLLDRDQDSDDLTIRIPRYDHVQKKLGYLMNYEDQKKFGYIESEVYIYERASRDYQLKILEISKEPTWIQKIIDLLKKVKLDQ